MAITICTIVNARARASNTYRHIDWTTKTPQDSIVIYIGCRHWVTLRYSFHAYARVQHRSLLRDIRALQSCLYVFYMCMPDIGDVNRVVCTQRYSNKQKSIPINQHRHRLVRWCGKRMCHLCRHKALISALAFVFAFALNIYIYCCCE